MILCICAIICWIIIVFSLTFLQQQKTDKKLSQVSKRLLLCCFSFLVFFYFPHRNMFQNAEPLKIDLTSNEETASLKGILSKERSNTILETCNHLYISRSVLKTLFDRSNGAIAYIYFSGRYDNRAKNYIAVRTSVAAGITIVDFQKRPCASARASQSNFLAWWPSAPRLRPPCTISSVTMHHHLRSSCTF